MPGGQSSSLSANGDQVVQVKYSFDSILFSFAMLLVAGEICTRPCGVIL